MRARYLMLVLLASCAVSEAQTDPSSRCRVDADCMIVTSPPSCGPCGTCPGPALALSRSYVRREIRACDVQRRREAAVRRRVQRGGRVPPVITPPNCEPCRPRPEGADQPWVAVCRAHVCEAHVAAGPTDAAVPDAR